MKGDKGAGFLRSRPAALRRRRTISGSGGGGGRLGGGGGGNGGPLAAKYAAEGSLLQDRHLRDGGTAGDKWTRATGRGTP